MQINMPRTLIHTAINKLSNSLVYKTDKKSYISLKYLVQILFKHTKRSKGLANQKYFHKILIIVTRLQ